MKRYSVEELEAIYRNEAANLTEEEIRKKAKQLHSQLNVLHVRWQRSNRRYYRLIDIYSTVLEFV